MGTTPAKAWVYKGLECLGEQGAVQQWQGFCLGAPGMERRGVGGRPGQVPDESLCRRSEEIVCPGELPITVWRSLTQVSNTGGSGSMLLCKESRAGEGMWAKPHSLQAGDATA